jgi:1-deoxy-D-xylulose-5-phosphate reductoisomerase
LKHISLLGSTGSIGRQTLDIVEAQRDDLRVVALAAGSKNLPMLAEQILHFRPELVAVPTAADATALKDMLAGERRGVSVLIGEAGLKAVATHETAQTVVTGLVGFLGLKPTAAAIKAGKTVALANKETLVAAGPVIMPMVRQYNATIVPVDSEHSAIFQSLCGHTAKDLSRIWLTASGGPFRTWTSEQIRNATADDALKHPNWSMGPKITIDSATLMNKGLEIIEARWLFDVPASNIRVVIHPQSILHSAVEFVDGSILGQMGLPDMHLPIHYAIFYPDRVPSSRVPRLDLATLSQLTFEQPDTERFPCLKLAQSVAEESSGTLPCVLNAANEIAVGAFLNGHIKFNTIAENIERVLTRHRPVSNPTLEDIFAADSWARSESESLIKATAS